MKISELKPNKVFYFFEEISKIPRGSGKEKQISDWLVNFAKERNLEVIQDEFHNVIIKKEATKGYEKYIPLILQGHIDMVWEKNKDVEFDFEKEGIRLKVEDDFLKAEGTTLGADNGIAVAIALAILDSNDLKHPALEVLFTSDEEVGMSGAINLNVDSLKGKKMINIDTEEFGAIYVSSAGGATIKLDSNLENYKISNAEKIYQVDILGLNGGHSGAEIHLKLGNSIKILITVLNQVRKDLDFRIISLDGGNKDNAIPREASVVFSSKSKIEDIILSIEKIFDDIKVEYEELDSKLHYKIVEIQNKEYKSISKEDTDKILNLYTEFPHGVISMSQKIEGLVQTSLNFGVLKTNIDNNRTNFNVRSLLRSSSLKELDELQERLILLSRKYDSHSEKVPSFMPWEYRENSTLRDLSKKVFKEFTGKEVEIMAIHAGLECGLFVNKIENLDVISMGPNIYGAHTPDERMEIKSVELIWEYIVKILESYNLVD